MNECEEQARNFLQATGTKIVIRPDGVVNGFPFDAKDQYPHYKYKVTLRRQGKQYTYPFYDSYYNYRKNKRPTEYDVLSCLMSYPVDENIFNFAAEFGYQLDDPESWLLTSKIHKECLRQYRRLCDLYSEDLMEKLADIR